MANTLPPLPCPFCNARPRLTVRPNNSEATEYFAAVACYCGGYSACAHKMATAPEADEAEASAIAAWNTRAALAAVPAQPVALMDDFGNALPPAANKGAGSWIDGHKRNWKPLYAAPQAVPVPAGWSVTYDGKRASYIYADQETAEFEAQQVGGTARAVAVYLASAPKEQR